MHNEEFYKVLKVLEEQCDAILLNRQAEYADEDRLSNFKQIAALTGADPQQVCMILQAKHFVALSKAIGEGRYDDIVKYIIDIINYQRLLYALICDTPPLAINEALGGYIQVTKCEGLK